MISYGHQSISEEDKLAVLRVLGSDFLTQGPEVEAFEQALCDHTGAKYCVCVSNGTAALHIAVAALKIPEKSCGITSPITFAASANCMIYNGLTPDFADIDPVTDCLDPEKTEKRLTARTRLLIPVHYAGAVCDMARFAEIARKHRLRVIEDAAHAIGSEYADGGRVGCCKYSDMTIFSFHPVKTITCGEGGAVTTNDPVLYERLKMLRSHGITKNNMSQNPGPWYYEMRALGFNYRLTDFQAALGRSQLARIDSFAAARRKIVRNYNRAFAGMPGLTVPSDAALDRECRHLYPLRIDFAALKKSRKNFMAELKSLDIGTQVHYIPVYRLPYYEKMFGYREGMCPEAENFYEQELSLPLYPGMTAEDVDRVISGVRECIKSVRSFGPSWINQG